ncbi:MAG: glycosyltransferase family 1 protein [Mucilaginibacter sp.]|nr:glycosyltransferase family 1 protein [Mucilaginibacter sp.]
MSITCNTRCMNSALTGVQRYTQKILESFPGDVKQIAPALNISRGITGHLWEQFMLPGKLGKNLLWSPSNSGPISYKRQVLTVHDVVSMDHPEWFNKNYVRWYNYMLPSLCQKVDHIITISEFSRQRILKLFKVPDSKVTLIYNGSDKIVSSSAHVMEPFKVPFNRYVLSLGSLEPRKNIPMLLNAWRNIIHQVPEDIGLIVVGGKGNSKIFKDAGINELPDRVYFTGHVKDDYIAQLYTNALFFVYLSVYEGFGLPPLEAMSVGTPVMTGNKTSLPEVVGDAGLLVDPYSLSECEKGLLKLINDEKTRYTLASKSIVQSAKFNWERASLQTWQILNRF